MGQSIPPVGLPLHVAEVPEYEPWGDCIRITWRGLELFVPVPIAKASIGRYNRALDQWHEQRGEKVVRFPAQPTIVAAE